MNSRANGHAHPTLPSADLGWNAPGVASVP
jgi:hypothetical protein